MNLFDLSREHLHKAQFLSERRVCNVIDGQDRPPLSGLWLPVTDPATEMLVAQAPDSDARDIDAAVAAAQRAFESAAWRGLRPADREKLLFKLSELIERHVDELSALETLQSGKLQGVARMIDVGSGAEFVRYMAGWATKLEGQTLDNSIPIPGPRWVTSTRREPLGVVGAIVPWNFPLAIALWKMAPALAAGCTVVLKPSEDTPLTALRLAQLALEAGIPPGVLNVVCGRGATAGAALIAHPGVRKLSFTGSTAVGKLVGHAAVENMARFTLELGGKSPAIVMEDADASQVAQGIAMGIFFHQGQVCTASSRLFVHRSLYKRVLDELAGIAQGMRIGSGFDAATQFGPLTSKAHFSRVMGYIASAKAEGATLVAGGDRALEAGCFVQPTVFADATASMRFVREEVFGPVLAVAPFDEVEEAIAAANDTPYGLAASLWTNSLSHTQRIVPRLQAGLVWVNAHNVLDAALPLGGVKQSGTGRDLGRAAVESFTELKSICVAA
jgi:phenylacetaldehyde dehydrogenase